MLRIRRIPTHTLDKRQTVLSLNRTQKIILTLLVAVLATVPLSLGLEHVRSAPSGPTSPPASPPTPIVSIDVPDEVLIGEDFSFEVKFKNSPGSAVGFGPYIALYLPAKGADGNGSGYKCDGISFKSAAALFTTPASVPLPPAYDSLLASNFCPNGYTLPFAGMTAVSSAPSGDYQLVVLELPFGSFDATQPEVVVKVDAHLSDYADLVTNTTGTPLKIFAQGGFRYGADALNNHPADPLIESAVVSDQTNPTVLKLKKIANAPEDETATGPNFLRKYTITADIADGQKIDKLRLQDFLPNNEQYQGMVNVKIGTTTATVGTCPGVDYQITQQPPTTAAQNPLTNELEISFCHQIIGTTAVADVTVTFAFFVPELNANLQTVLPPNCKPATSINDIKADGYWTPADPRDLPMIHISSDLTLQDHILKDKCIAIQKSVVIANDTGAPGLTPGDTLQYTLQFQISDYKTFRDLVVNDYLSNSQIVGSTFMLSVSDQFGMKTGVIPPAFITQTPDASGVLNFCPAALKPPQNGTLITLNISQAMAAIPGFVAPRLNAGILTGGYAAGIPPPHNPAIGKITFQAKVLDVFQFPVSPGDKFVDKDDPEDNCVIINGTVLKNINRPNPINLNTNIPSVPVATASDDSNTATLLIGDTLMKTVYAVQHANPLGVYSPVCGPPTGPFGTTCSNYPNPPQEVRPGDKVTYRIVKILPSSDAENLVVEDWLPQPTYTAAGISFANSLCSGLPGPGNGCLGPTDTLHSLPVSPTVMAHPLTNSITFNYGTFDDTANLPRTMDLLFTYQVTNLPFADGLFLANEAQECETNTFGAPFCQVSIAQVNVRQPNLRIRKGAIATDNPWGLFTFQAQPHQGVQTAISASALSPRPATTFDLNGITGLISSNDLASNYVNDDLSNVDANDVVAFAITIENLGGQTAYDTKIEELIPTTLGSPNMFTIVPGSIKVKRGTGATVLSSLYTVAPIGIANGFTVTAISSLLAPIPAYNATNGSNIIVITFRAQLLGNVQPGCRNNVAKLEHYASTPGGPDFVSAGFTPLFEDPAEVCVRPLLTKSLVATSEAHTLGSDVTIGEIARYRLLQQLPETALLTNFQVKDALPPGLKFLPGSARIALVSNQGSITRTSPLLSSTGHNLPGFLPPSGTSVNSTPALLPGVVTGGTGCGSPVTFNFGDVKNNDNDSDREFIVIEFDAQVCNVATNVNNTSLANNFSVSVNNTTIATSPPINVTVVEPNLTIAKAASPTTVVQGGTVGYTITITNTSPTRAFDVQFTDTLPTGLNFVSGSTTVSAGCSAPIVNAATPAVSCGSVAGGGGVTIHYNAIANPSSCPVTLTNQAAVTWTSLTGPKGTAINPTLSDPTLVLGASGANGLTDGERNGVTPPLTLNKYAATASAPLTVTCSTCLSVSHETLTCNPNGSFNDTFTVTNLTSFPVAAVNFSPITSNVTITPSSLAIPLAAGASTTISVTIGGSGAVSGATVCFWVGLAGPVAPSCRIQHCVTLPSCQASACATPPAGMVAWWPLDETSGNVVHSIVGNHDGTTLPGPIGTGSLLVATAPKVGSALFFGAAKAEVPDDPALNFGTGDFSIDAWVRSNQSTLLSAVVDKLDTSTPARKGYAFFVQNGRLQLVMANGTTTSTFQSNNTFVANGTWRHVAVTVRRLGGGPVGQFYLDGAPVGPTFTPLAGNIDSSASSTKLLIGNYRLSNSACSCEVSLDEIELFNTVVPPADIKSIFQADQNGKCKLPDLTIAKKADCGSAAGLPPGTCRITLTVGNNGPGPFNGILTVQDLVTPPPSPGLSWAGSSTPSGWSCGIGPSDTIGCGSTGSVSLAPGQHTTFSLLVNVPGGHYKNCASVKGYTQFPYNSSTLIQEANSNNNQSCVPMP